MAKLGVKTVDELVGRGDLLKKRDNLSERQSKIDLDCILNNPFDGKKQSVIFDPKQVYDFELSKTKDMTEIMTQLKSALESGQSARLRLR